MELPYPPTTFPDCSDVLLLLPESVWHAWKTIEISKMLVPSLLDGDATARITAQLPERYRPFYLRAGMVKQEEPALAVAHNRVALATALYPNLHRLKAMTPTSSQVLHQPI
jgi:hypothetical protein